MTVVELRRETTAGCLWQCNCCRWGDADDMASAADHVKSTGHSVYEVAEGTKLDRWNGWASGAGRFMYSRDGQALVKHRRLRGLAVAA